MISVSVVGAVAVICIIKKRRRKSSIDIEKLDVQPFVPELQEVQGIHFYDFFLWSVEKHSWSLIDTSFNISTFSPHVINIVLLTPAVNMENEI